MTSCAYHDPANISRYFFDLSDLQGFVTHACHPECLTGVDIYVQYIKLCTKSESKLRPAKPGGQMCCFTRVVSVLILPSSTRKY